MTVQTTEYIHKDSNYFPRVCSFIIQGKDTLPFSRYFHEFIGGAFIGVFRPDLTTSFILSTAHNG